MRRLLEVTALFGLLVLFSGCTLCCAPFDADYPYVGGSWVRYNPSSGRVGSAFDEAGGPALPVTESTATGEPTPAARPAAPPTLAPKTRSVIPRNLGETYLP